MFKIFKKKVKADPMVVIVGKFCPFINKQCVGDKCAFYDRSPRKEFFCLLVAQAFKTSWDKRMREEV